MRENILMPDSILVCFALEEEARPFRKRMAYRQDVVIRIVGVGRKNAERSIQQALEGQAFRLVLTCGYAGGLNPRLKHGQVIFDSDSVSGLDEELKGLGATPVKFLCAERIVSSIAEKRQLHTQTGADVVEMESDPIRQACRAKKIPSATVRVISDTADENLPLDFNRIMDANMDLSFTRLAREIAGQPSVIPALIRLRNSNLIAANNMAEVLMRLTQS